MRDQVAATTRLAGSKILKAISSSQTTIGQGVITSPVERILLLQRTIGNRTVQQLLQSGGLSINPALQRVVWYPNRDTGKDSKPWGSGPSGDVLEATTDSGTMIKTWRPHDGVTYWCHGFTFGGATAKDGPYSLGGRFVPRVIQDDGWRRVHACMAGIGDIMVFYDKRRRIAHTGIIRSVFNVNNQIDEQASQVQSKWGQGALNINSWVVNSKKYGEYRCFSKNPAQGVCNGNGPNEL